MGGIQLLLLDDHALFRVMLSRLLESDGRFHVVANCAASPDALEVLARARVDMVLVDYDLGHRETGLQFVCSAREAAMSACFICHSSTTFFHSTSHDYAVQNLLSRSVEDDQAMISPEEASAI